MAILTNADIYCKTISNALPTISDLSNLEWSPGTEYAISKGTMAKSKLNKSTQVQLSRYIRQIKVDLTFSWNICECWWMMTLHWLQNDQQ